MGAGRKRPLDYDGLTARGRAYRRLRFDPIGATYLAILGSAVAISRISVARPRLIVRNTGAFFLNRARAGSGSEIIRAWVNSASASQYLVVN